MLDISIDESTLHALKIDAPDGRSATGQRFVGNVNFSETNCNF